MQNDTMNMISDPFTNCIIPFLLSKASILAKSGFNLATFIEEVRAVMGVPDWFLYLDSRRTRRVHSNKCVQIRIHFAGPQANRLEQDFNTLLRTGKLPQPSIYIPGKKNIQNRETRNSPVNFSSPVNFFLHRSIWGPRTVQCPGTPY